MQDILKNLARLARNILARLACFLQDHFYWVSSHPDNVTILTGQSLTLACDSTGTDVMYQWMRNGVIISDDNSNVLIINDIKQSDDGTYQCIASNKGGNATTNPAKITVYGERI